MGPVRISGASGVSQGARRRSRGSACGPDLPAAHPGCDVSRPAEDGLTVPPMGARAPGSGHRRARWENVRMDGLACPCGLGDDYESCCGRLHAGAPAPTAESLMRSRYSAFAVGDAGYLLRTWHPSRRPRTLSLDPALRWTRLAVLETRDGGLFDATGTVQFRAMYVQQGKRGVLAETSRFVRQDGHWTYLGPVD